MVSLWLGVSFGQRLEKISIMATTEAIAFPFSRYFPLHPGIDITGTLKEVEKPKSTRSFNARIGMFYHRRIETGIYLGGEYLFSYKLIKEKLGLDLPVGLGYFHSIYPGEVYRQTDGGDFEEFNPIGRPSVYVNFGVGFTYFTKGNIHPFVRQEVLLEYPLFPHSFFKLGIQINTKKS